MTPSRDLLHVNLELFEFFHRGSKNGDPSLSGWVILGVEIGVVGLGWYRLSVIGWVAVRFGRENGQLSSLVRR